MYSVHDRQKSMMPLLEELLNNEPSMKLQREAANFIARLDSQLEYQIQENIIKQQYILKLEKKVKEQADRISDYAWRESPGQGCY